MGANLELTAYCKKIVELNQLVNALKKINYNVELVDAELIDDWRYNNEQKLTSSFNWHEVYENILENKIFLSWVKINTINSGYHATLNKDGVFEITVWLDTSKLEHLELDEINEANRLFYDNLTYKIIDILKDKSLILFGMGVETNIDYDNNIEAILRNSHCIVRWIVPTDSSLEVGGL